MLLKYGLSTTNDSPCLTHTSPALQPTAHTRLHWSAELAARLLRDRADCNRQQQMQAPRSSAQAQLDSTSWCTWLHSLPPSVVTPLQFTESELTAIGDPVVMEEVKGMQACIRACYEVRCQSTAGKRKDGWVVMPLVILLQQQHCRAFPVHAAILGLHGMQCCVYVVLFAVAASASCCAMIIGSMTLMVKQASCFACLQLRKTLCQSASICCTGAGARAAGTWIWVGRLLSSSSGTINSHYTMSCP